MNQEIKAQWVAALRSGEYQQGKAALHSFDEDGHAQFCCLGVLCDLSAKAGVGVEVLELEGSVLYDRFQDFLPTVVMKWAGLENSVGRLPGRDTDEGALYQLNDSGFPFSAIADVIEREF